jgi:hypothetical protein
MDQLQRVLVLQEATDGGEDVIGLGQDFVFELGLIGAESVHGGDAANGSIEITE